MRRYPIRLLEHPLGSLLIRCPLALRHSQEWLKRHQVTIAAPDFGDVRLLGRGAIVIVLTILFVDPQHLLNSKQAATSHVTVSAPPEFIVGSSPRFPGKEAADH